MPFRQVTIRTRRGELILVILFGLALASATTAFIAHLVIHPVVYAPLQVPAKLELANGAPGTDPPQIVAGMPLSFTPQVWCNNSGHELVVHLSITLASLDQPVTTVSVLSGFGYVLTKGCTPDHGLPIKPPQPLTPGMWFADVTISANEGGKSQVVTVPSKPFQVVNPP